MQENEQLEPVQAFQIRRFIIIDGFYWKTLHYRLNNWLAGD